MDGAGRWVDMPVQIPVGNGRTRNPIVSRETIKKEKVEENTATAHQKLEPHITLFDRSRGRHMNPELESARFLFLFF